MHPAIDKEFKSLIPGLREGELITLEESLRSEGCRNALVVWDGAGVLLDGHNRLEICERLGIPFETQAVELPSREHAKLWIQENQLGRRNLTDDQRALVADAVAEQKSKLRMYERAREAGKAGGRGRRPGGGNSLGDTAPRKLERRSREERSDVQVSRAAGVSERKMRMAREVRKADPVLSKKVHSGQLTLLEAKRIASLDPDARSKALAAIDCGADARSAAREAKKAAYNEKVATAKPKPLEGTYRILYADPPWKYYGLNQADEHGHAERHYDCLSDSELVSYELAGRKVAELADENAVMFMWTTSPILMAKRCFPVIEAWGFEPKECFVWDKVKHVMGFYNSVRHEFLLICTRGSCTPDSGKLTDSVQTIERGEHSAKPERFYEIIESMYHYGRKLELFARKKRNGWDAVGNEISEL